MRKRNGFLPPSDNNSSFYCKQRDGRTSRGLDSPPRRRGFHGLQETPHLLRLCQICWSFVRSPPLQWLKQEISQAPAVCYYSTRLHAVQTKPSRPEDTQGELSWDRDSTFRTLSDCSFWWGGSPYGPWPYSSS